MTEEQSATGRTAAGSAGALARRIGRAAARALTHALGGEERTRVILMLAAVLALSSADASTVGASATHLRSSASSPTAACRSSSARPIWPEAARIARAIGRS